MTKKHGLIVNDGIFYNPDHIIKMTKYDNDVSDTHWIEIHMTNGMHSTLSFATKEDAEKFASSLAKQATVTSFKKETKQHKAPKLFSLSDLQVQASKQFSYTPDKTLEIAQSLYEKHKILSYPRTSGNYLASGKAKDFEEVVSMRITKYLLIIAVIFGLFFWFMYNKTTHGKYMYAIGGNEVAAEVSGVNTVKSKILIYMTAGIMYALAGYLLAGKAGGATSALGTGYELEAIAGCTIGGVSTTGGIGTVGGILVGVLVFELLKIVLQFLGVNPYYNYIVQGLVIVVAVALDIRKYVKKK